MKSYRSFSIFIMGFLIYFCHSARRQYSNIGKGYSVRIIHVNQCAGYDELPHINFVKFVTHNSSQFMNAEGILNKPLHLKEIRAVAERCLDYRYACETFINWTLSKPCIVMKMKNQLWTPIADSVTPTTWRRTCPLLEKGVYRFTNCTVDLEAFIKFVPDVLRYYWNAKFIGVDEKKEIQICVYAEGHFYTYTKRTYVNFSSNYEYIF